jgi:hypothetical protein
MSAANFDFTAYLRQPFAAGRMVKLHDGRIGLIDTVETNTLGGVTARRAYIVGVEKEFGAWVTRFEIARYYGVVDEPQPASYLYDVAALPGGDPNANVITKEAYIAWLINECKTRGFDPSRVAENATEATFSA